MTINNNFDGTVHIIEWYLHSCYLIYIHIELGFDQKKDKSVSYLELSYNVIRRRIAQKQL